MDVQVRGITADGLIKACAIESTALTERMRNIHRTLPVATAALGRTLAAASMMGGDIKNEKGSVTVQIRGGGPLGAMIAVSDSSGNVRGYVQQPATELPLRADGKLNVGEAVGADGILTVIRDMGEGQPFSGKVQLVGGEIAEDVAAYFAESEQIPTVCALGVLVDRDQSVRAAGGYIIQLMPGATDETAAALEEKVRAAGAVTSMLDRGLGAWDILKYILGDMGFERLSENEVRYECKCARTRVKRALVSLGKEELSKMAAEGKPISITCRFCDKVYSFTPEQLADMA